LITARSAGEKKKRGLGPFHDDDAGGKKKKKWKEGRLSRLNVRREEKKKRRIEFFLFPTPEEKKGKEGASERKKGKRETHPLAVMFGKKKGRTNLSCEDKRGKKGIKGNESFKFSGCV